MVFVQWCWVFSFWLHQHYLFVLVAWLLHFSLISVLNVYCLVFEYCQHSFMLYQTLWTYHLGGIIINTVFIIIISTIFCIISTTTIIIIVAINIIIFYYCCCYRFQVSILPLGGLSASHTSKTTWNRLITNHLQDR